MNRKTANKMLFNRTQFASFGCWITLIRFGRVCVSVSERANHKSCNTPRNTNKNRMRNVISFQIVNFCRSHMLLAPWSPIFFCRSSFLFIRWLPRCDTDRQFVIYVAEILKNQMKSTRTKRNVSCNSEGCAVDHFAFATIQCNDNKIKSIYLQLHAASFPPKMTFSEFNGDCFSFYASRAFFPRLLRAEEESSMKDSNITNIHAPSNRKEP